LLNLFDVENVVKSFIVKSAQSNFKDFEEGIQNFCTEESNHEIVIARNVKDFKSNKLATLNPTEGLMKISNGL
jgi:hypothetical protein|tara:strand:+ start:1585 stop:1803 length:219 start_codon:yes stop_codon:yes gene_type:complete